MNVPETVAAGIAGVAFGEVVAVPDGREFGLAGFRTRVEPPGVLLRTPFPPLLTVRRGVATEGAEPEDVAEPAGPDCVVPGGGPLGGAAPAGVFEELLDGDCVVPGGNAVPTGVDPRWVIISKAVATGIDAATAIMSEGMCR